MPGVGVEQLLIRYFSLVPIERWHFDPFLLQE
jgi:hypothetical protein